jgi:hypothetical protein
MQEMGAITFQYDSNNNTPKMAQLLQCVPLLGRIAALSMSHAVEHIY